MNSRIKENVQKIFELWCEVSTDGLTAANISNGTQQQYKISSQFPEHFSDKDVLADIQHFANPCDFESKTVQTYSFVLTSSESKFRFGFCRREPNTHTAYVILTYLPWHDIFIKFLNILVELRKRNVIEFKEILHQVYNASVPDANASLKINYDHGLGTFSFQRPSQFQLPSIPENHNLNLYYNFVEPKNMIAIFAAMLNERRIIFTSRRLDILSSCIQAANYFLFPLCWQHIFIPVLPNKMKDILLAPMPFLIGVPEAVFQSVRPEEIGDVVVLYCDKKTVISPFDDVRDFPAELVNQLKKHLNNPAEHRGDRVSRVFLRVLVQLIGGYREMVREDYEKRITWDAESFIESKPSSLRPFLKKMMDLQIFQQFIEERLKMLNSGQGYSDEFELETVRFSTKKERNYKEFLRNVKDKTNPAMKSAVKSVKEGGKGVKTAYKDLKSKLKNSSRVEFHGEENNNNSYKDENHNSAPSSPVLSNNTSVMDSTDYYSAHLLQQPSSSTMDRHFSSASMPQSGVTSSSIVTPSGDSTSSSSSISEMNLLQEIQQHDFFKSTATSNSPPNPDETPSTIAPSIPNQRRIAIPPAFLVDESRGGSAKINNNRAITNQLPVLPVPKVPPKRPPPIVKWTSSNASVSLPPASSSYQSPHISNYSSISFPSSQSKVINKAQSLSPPAPIQSPIPPPRRTPASVFSSNSICSEQKATIPDDKNGPEPDLIKLDTSIDLEDFDPLNEKAKPIPNPSPLKNCTATIGNNGVNAVDPCGGDLPAVSLLSFNNPHYPYYQPTNSSTSPLPFVPSPAVGDEVELLRKYGLDRFSIVEQNDGDTTPSVRDAQTNSQSQRSNWTTFD